MPSPETASVGRQLLKVEYTDPAGTFAGWFFFGDSTDSGHAFNGALTRELVMQKLIAMGFGTAEVTISHIYVTDPVEFAVWST